MRRVRATLWAIAAIAIGSLHALGAANPAEDSDLPQAAPGQLLIAAPEMGDPRFSHTVILLVRHERSGAFGLIVNRPVETVPLARLLGDLGESSDGASGTIAVFAGGPVETAIGFVLHSAEYHLPETMAIGDKLAITSSPQVLRDIAAQHGPAKYLFAFGYAGWGPGQLEDELKQRAWFTAPGDAKLLFDGDRSTLWQDALDRRERAL